MTSAEDRAGRLVRNLESVMRRRQTLTGGTGRNAAATDAALPGMLNRAHDAIIAAATDENDIEGSRLDRIAKRFYRVERWWYSN